MSATDVAAPPTGPDLQDVKGPTIEDPTAVSSLTDPTPGPDGRIAVETVANKTNIQSEHQHEEERSLSPNNGELKIEIKIERYEKADDVENQAPRSPDNKTEMEQKAVKGTAKITEFKLPDRAENDSGKGDDVSDNADHVVDIVKQSKLKQSRRGSSSDIVESLPEFPLSRPLTETSVREGTRVSYDTERDRKDQKSDMDREVKTPFSVKVERKPLHTAQTRSHSDYYSKSSITVSRYTHMATSLGQLYGFPMDPTGKDMRYPPPMHRMRRPPKLVRLATVTMSPRIKPVPRGPSLYYEEPKKPTKVITWDEAMDCRPPLRIDMEGPGPTNYTPRIKPLNEINSPAWTFGSKCYIEKDGGSRTSWEKTWFQNPEVWTSKVDFYNDSAWPTPTHYRQRPSLGPRQRTMVEAPSFSIGTRREMTLNKRGSDKDPSPVDYDKEVADKIVMTRAPSFSHQFRREGTVAWCSKDKVPGPGAYSPKFSYNKPHGPSFSIRSLRREKSHELGPFSTF